MSITSTVPAYCSNCEHKDVCKILVHIQDGETFKNDFNTKNATALQGITNITYDCRFKKKIV
jgi:hypothetical protein